MAFSPLLHFSRSAGFGTRRIFFCSSLLGHLQTFLYFPFVLDYRTFLSVGFIYYVYPCPVEISRVSILLLWSFYTLFTICPFETKRESICLIWTEIVFLTGQVFLSHNGQRESLLVFLLAPLCCTKSLSCIVADFTGMPYQFKVFKYSEFISLMWKRPYYDKIGVTSVKKEFSDSKKTLQSLQLSKSRIPSLSSEQPSETPGHSSVSNINNDAFN